MGLHAMTKLLAFFLLIILSYKTINCYDLGEKRFLIHHDTCKKGIPELAYLNKSVDPCQNFYQFTCGNFKNINPMPEDKNIQIWDHFVIIQNEIHEFVQEMLKSPWPYYDELASESKAFLKAKSFYKACTDIQYADKLTLPHLEVLREFGQWPAIIRGPFQGRFNWDELGHLIAEYGVQFFFTMQVIPNNFNASENVILLQEDVLSNPSNIHDFFEEELEKKMRFLFSSENRDNLLPVHVFFNKIAFKLRDLLGTFKPNHDISDDIAETIAFMRNISRKGIVEENAVIEKFNATLTIADLQEWTEKHFGDDLKHLNWTTFLQNTFKYSGTKITPDMKVMPVSSNNTYGILNLMRQTEDRILFNFIYARLFTYMAPDSDSYMREAFNTLYEKLDWPVYKRDKYCIRKLLGYSGNIDLSYAVTYQYQKYHFNTQKLKKAQHLITQIRTSFLDTLASNTWMDAESKAKTMVKANKMLVLLGFPNDAATAENVDKYYRNLRVSGWDHGGNARRLRAFRMAQNYMGMETGRERDMWTLSPLEVNAVYNRPNNKILLPISMLNNVFFDGKVSALDYGRLGSTIGHEIMHGFDESGRQYDENGNLANWWTNETKETYSRRIECFKEQYATYYIEEIDRYVNENKTLNENLADNVGLNGAYRAFKKAQKERDFKPIEGYSAEQLFFIGYGTMWCMQETNYYLIGMQEGSGYAPGRYRVIGAISNMKAFAKAFRCSANAPMNPRRKCTLW